MTWIQVAYRLGCGALWTITLEIVLRFAENVIVRRAN